MPTHRALSILTGFFVVLSMIGLAADPAAAQKKKKTIAEMNLEDPPCEATLDACPDTGCSRDGHHDPLLNGLKNIAVEPSGTPEDVTLDWMMKLKNPRRPFKANTTRVKLTNLGEGKYIRTVGYLLAVKPEPGGESCNCGLHTPEWTDNHLVLVNPSRLEGTLKLPPNATSKKLKDVFHAREKISVTAEFTPRVRKEHPHFTNELVQPMLNKTAQGAIWVRITGLLMFDSEHFIRNKLNRKNNWEVHPVFKLEYCPAGKTCAATGTVNWVDIDQ